MGTDFLAGSETLQTTLDVAAYLSAAILGGLAARLKRKAKDDPDTLRSDLDAVQQDITALRNHIGQVQADIARGGERDARIDAALKEVLAHANEASNQIAYLRGRYDAHVPPPIEVVDRRS